MAATDQMQQQQQQSDDIFSSLLDLEEQYYAEGYALGTADGAQAGRTEGRVFGLEKGFEKFVEMGRLRGRAVVWSAQVDGDQSGAAAERLKRHVDRLTTLTDPETFTTENAEDAVTEVDDRIKDAKGKERIIKRVLGERKDVVDEQADGSQPAPSAKTVRIKRVGARSPTGSHSATGRAGTGEMEDFMGLPGTKRAG